MPNLPKTVRRSWQGPEKKPFERQQRNKMLYTYRWAQMSKAFRAENPICAECERNGKITMATLVDHIKRVMGAPTEQEREILMWSIENMQSLCDICHNKKSQNERC